MESSDRPTADTNGANQHSEQNGQSPPARPVVTMGPSILLVLYAIVGTLSTIVGALAHQGAGGDASFGPRWSAGRCCPGCTCSSFVRGT